jgi:hypothetical protein
MRKRKELTTPNVVSRRIDQFCAETGIGRCTVYKAIAAGELETAKIYGARVILTEPREFVKRFQKGGEL